MDTPSTTKSDQAVVQNETTTVVEELSSSTPADPTAKQAIETKPKAKTKKSKAKTLKPSKPKSKKSKKVESSSESSDSSDSSSTSDASDDGSSDVETTDTEDQKRKKWKKRKAQKKAKKAEAKKSRVENNAGKAKSTRRTAKVEISSSSGSEAEDDTASETEESNVDDSVPLDQQLLRLQIQYQQLLNSSVVDPWGQLGKSLKGKIKRSKKITPRQVATLALDPAPDPAKAEEPAKKIKAASKLEYKVLDQIWDDELHDFKLQEAAEHKKAIAYEEFLFIVRRKFDYEGKYEYTRLDIHSVLIKEVLQKVMVDVKGISLVEETPSLEPNMVFLFLEDIRKYRKELKNKKIMATKGKKKLQKRNSNTRKHLKVLIGQIDKEYEKTKNTFYPMADAGLVTFELLWALYKPNTTCYTTTYGSIEEPRAFKVELCEKHSTLLKGDYYTIEGRYLEYDGKAWGMGKMSCDVPEFKGAKKISSLICYPLKYHAEEAKLRADMIERGKKFVSLQGVNYRAHEGMAFYKKQKQIIKVNIKGRIMVDPALHRRINPNYQISSVKPKDPNEIESELEEEGGDGKDNSCDGCCDSSSNDEAPQFRAAGDEKDSRTKLKVVYDKVTKQWITAEVQVDENGKEIKTEVLEDVKQGESSKKRMETDNNEIPIFDDEEYLIASPVVLGFAFAEKLWLEFTVSGIKEIAWNEGAYESLVLEDNTKDIVKALVESHKYHPAQRIDDVIQGKGKGLVAVLHGPPGTGKTLTAEGISEHLKCPLYMVSAGELGTSASTLEHELQRILDIAHSWGAVLLLDEADVFLEKRTIQDIHRNALVSIFLRLLEYFQGVLFLTTNRVESFDDAFQSRIHIALRYGDLTPRAKKSIFKIFIERVRAAEGSQTMPFSEEDYDRLARHNLNGRQIKNTVRTAQALALNKAEPLAMEHIKRVIEVQNNFEKDLKGGPGYETAMQSYF